MPMATISTSATARSLYTHAAVFDDAARAVRDAVKVDPLPKYFLWGRTIERYAPGRAKRWRVVRGRRAVRGGFRHAPAHAVEPLWASAVPRRGALDRRAAEAGRVPRDPEHCAETVGARGTGKSRRAYRGPAHTGSFSRATFWQKEYR
jgi:hypothetical protein